MIFSRKITLRGSDTVKCSLGRQWWDQGQEGSLAQTVCPHPHSEQGDELGTSAECLLSHPSSLASGNKHQSKYCLPVKRAWPALCSCLPCALQGAVSHDIRERDTEHNSPGAMGVQGGDEQGISAGGKEGIIIYPAGGKGCGCG